MLLKVQFSSKAETLGDFFSSILAFVDRVTWYVLLLGGGKYPVELVEVPKSWPRHHDYQNKTCH